MPVKPVRKASRSQQAEILVLVGVKSAGKSSIGSAYLRAKIHLGYAGLSSVDLHLKRVRARVAKGGHDTPEADIRRRWVQSHLNLIRLVPSVSSLRVYDNSAEDDPVKGMNPSPNLVLEIAEKKLVFPSPEQLVETPAWDKPLVLAASIILPANSKRKPAA